MAKKSTSRSGEETLNTLNQDFQETRTVWNEGVDAMTPTVQDLVTQITQFCRDLYVSPLGKRAQRHPVAAIGLASLALVVCRRLLRR
jgi:hypothetical protein